MESCRLLPLGIQALVWSYLSTFERLVFSWAPTQKVCVRYLNEPTCEWFSYNPDCTIYFINWLMACCRRYRCIYIGNRPATRLGFVVTSRGCCSSSISTKLFPREPDLLMVENGDSKETWSNLVRIGKKDLSNICVVKEDCVMIRGLPIPVKEPWGTLNGLYHCSNVWQGKYVVVFNYTEYCNVWCITTLTVVHKIYCPSAICSAYVLDENLIYLGAENGTVYTYDTVLEKLLKSTDAFIFAKSQPSFRPKSANHLLSLTGQRLLIGSEDSNRMVVVDTREGHRPNFFLSGHDDCISCVEQNRDRSMLVSCDFNGGVRIWRDTGQELVLERHHQVDEQVNCCTFHPDGSMVIAHSRCGAIWALFRSGGYQPILLLKQQGLFIESLSFHPSGRYLACAQTSNYRDTVCLVDTCHLLRGEWVTSECVPVSRTVHISFLDPQRLFVLSSSMYNPPVLHKVEWLDGVFY